MSDQKVLHEWRDEMGHTNRLMSDGRLFFRLDGEDEWDEIEEIYPAKKTLGELARILSEGRWIPVSEKQPADGEWCLWWAPVGKWTAIPHDPVIVADYDPGEATHWRPLKDLLPDEELETP